MSLKFTFSVLLLLNCETIFAQTREENISFSNDELVKKSVIPFYLEEVLQKVNATPNYEVELFEKISKSCELDLMEWISQLLQVNSVLIDFWALTLIDSWGKPASGILNQEWSKAALGDTDECLRVSANTNQRNFQGKYCLNQIRSKSLPAYRDYKFLPLVGSCIPSSCTPGDAYQLVQNAQRLLKLEPNMEIEVLDCFTSQKDGVDGWQTMFFVLGALVFISILAAIFEATARRKLNVRESWMRQIFESFSLAKNLRAWLRNDEEVDLTCIYGIQFLTVSWIILVHSWELPFIGYLSTWKYHSEELIRNDWSTLVITNGGVALDTLLTISGLTVTYKLMLELDKFNGKISISIFYLRRLLRFIPTYAIVIGFMATLYQYFGSGALSGIISHSAQNCQVNWWKNILFVNNIVNPTVKDMCITDSWYFAAEMQFFVLTPFIVFLFWKYSKFGFGLLATLLVGSILTPALLTFYGDQLPTALSNRNDSQYFEDMHVKPWIRASPFLLGILCGYFLHSGWKRSRISKPLIVAFWLLSTALALAVIFVLFPYNNPHEIIPEAESAIYAGLHRAAWGAMISWTIFACAKGYGGWINTFLSLKVFRPLSRLTITAFLVALPVQMVLHLRFRELLLPDTYTKINLFLADLFMTYFVAWLLTIFVELPCLQIEKEFMQRRVEDYEQNHPAVAQLQPPAERYGIYYNKDVSLCIEESKNGRRRRTADSTVQPSCGRERYGIYYENNSVSINLSKEAKASHR